MLDDYINGLMACKWIDAFFMPWGDLLPITALEKGKLHFDNYLGISNFLPSSSLN